MPLDNSRADPIGRIPQQIREAKRWLLWRYKKPRKAGGKPRKVPHYVNGDERQGKLDTAEDLARLGTLAEAVKAFERGDWEGLGFALGPDGDGGCWQGIDFDHLSEHPELQALAGELPGYVERSPSGDGLHAIGYGESFNALASNQTGIEAYSRGRYFTVTGRVVGGDIEDVSSFVKEELRPRHASKPTAETAADSGEAWGLGKIPDYLQRYISGASSANEDLCAGLGVEFTKANVERFRSAASVLDLDDEWTYRRFVWACRAMGEAWQDECRRACKLRSEKFDQGVFDGDWARGDIGRISERWVFNEAARLGWQEPQTTAPDESGLVEVDLSSFERLQPEPVESLLGAYLPAPHVTLLGGHGGSGKSFLSLIWAVHVALGEPWGGLRTKAGRVLFLSLEDGADVLLWRLRKIVDGYGLGGRLDELRASISLVDGSKSDGALVREVFLDGVRDVEPTPLFRQFEQKASEFNPDLIIIDNASDAFAANEIQRQAVRKFIRILARLGEQHNAAVLLLAHIDKNAAKNGANGNSYSGSTQWHNSTRSRVAFVDNQIAHEKSNHSRLADDLPVYWDESAGVFKPDPGGSQRQLIQAQKSQSDDDAVLAAMISVHGRGENLPSAEKGPSTLWHAIRGDLPEVLGANTGEAKRRVHEAADRLHEAGKLEACTFKGANRSNRNGWKPV
jgi:hypothetical protein